MHIAGLTRELPICKVNDHLDIAAFIMFSDVELTEACAAALLKKAPEFDVILTAEAKGIPWLTRWPARAASTGSPRRKGAKLYMKEPVIIEDQSITTAGKQTLVIDKKDIDYMNGKRILIVDDGHLHRRLSARPGDPGRQEHRHRCWLLRRPGRGGMPPSAPTSSSLEPLPLFAH